MWAGSLRNVITSSMINGQAAVAPDVQPRWQGLKDRDTIDEGQKVLQTF